MQTWSYWFLLGFASLFCISHIFFAKFASGCKWDIFVSAKKERNFVPQSTLPCLCVVTWKPATHPASTYTHKPPATLVEGLIPPALHPPNQYNIYSAFKLYPDTHNALVTHLCVWMLKPFARHGVSRQTAETLAAILNKRFEDLRSSWF